MKKSIKYTVITLAALAFSILVIDRMPQFITIIALAWGLVSFIRRKIEGEMRTRLISLFIITFLIGVFLSLFIYDRTVDTKYYGFSYKGDDYVYGDFGTIAGNFWRKGIFPSVKELAYYNLIGGPTGKLKLQMFQFYNAFIFFLFGSCGGQILLIMNCFFHAAIIVPVYFICRDLEIRNKIITFVFVLFLFWPSTFFWSVMNFKEPMILFAIFLIFALLTKMKRKILPTDAIFFLILLSVIYSIKAYFVYIFAAMLFLDFLLFYKGPHKKISILAVLTALLSKKLLDKSFLSELYDRIPKIPSYLCRLRFVAATSDSKTSYLTDLFTTTYAGTFFYLPFGIAAVLFLPFLLRPFSLFHIGANVESVLWWCLIPLLIHGIWISVKREFKKTFPILATFIIWLGILVITQANMGTLVRQKALLYYAGFVFVGLAIDRSTAKLK